MKSIEFDQEKYEGPALAFLRGYLNRFLKVLDREDVIEIGPDGLSNKDLNRAYVLCFFSLGALENLDRVEVEGRKYLALLAFGVMPLDQVGLKGPETSELIVATSNRTQFHGGLDDRMIQEIATELYEDRTGNDSVK